MATSKTKTKRPASKAAAAAKKAPPRRAASKAANKKPRAARGQAGLKADDPRKRPVMDRHKNEPKPDAPKKTPARVPVQKRAAGRAVIGDFSAPLTEPSGDTKASGASAVANALLRTTDSLSGTIHDEARRQKIRQTKATSPRAVVTVHGRKTEVVARPERLDPEPVLPHKRDTIIKDDLRDTGNPDDLKLADAPDSSPTGGEWRQLVAADEAKAPAQP